MATVKNNLQDGGVLLVAQSDERMAAVEESKRTGQPVQSVGAKGDELVKVSGVVEETRRVSTEQYGSGDYPMQDYLHELIEGVDDREALNQKLAREHLDVSNEIVRNQMKVRNELRDVDPNEVADANQELNEQLAADYRELTKKFVEQKARDRNGIEQEIREIRGEDLFSPDPVTVLGKLAKDKPTDISQSQDDEVHKQRERIIYGVDSFKDQAFSARKFSKQAAGDDRAQSLLAVDASEGNLGEKAHRDGGSQEQFLKQADESAEEEKPKRSASRAKREEQTEPNEENKG